MELKYKNTIFMFIMVNNCKIITLFYKKYI